MRPVRYLLLAFAFFAAAAAQAQSVSTPAAACSFCSVNVTWSGIVSPTSTDWIALAVPGSANSAYLAWRYTTGAASGTVPLSIPGSVPFGTYVIRLFAANGFTLLATSASFQVQPTVSGTITSGGSPLAGVSIGGTSGANCSSTTDASGNWGCLIPVGWSGTITPTKAGSLFSPASRSFTNVTNHINTQNFATATTHAVSGTITLGGVALSGVAMAGTNGASCTTTNASGQYTCAVLPGWSGTVTPTLAGHAFTPAPRSYSNVTANQSAQDYSAFYALTGTVTGGGSPLSGVAMGATGGVTCSNSDGSGNYICAVPPGWSGTVTPSLSATIFTPASRSYSNVNAAQSAQNYQVLQTVSGTITAGGQPLGGVGLTASNGGTCTATNSSGQYACTVLQGWSGSVTPSLSGYTFTPTSRSYSNLTADQTAQDYTSAINTSAARIFYVEVDHLNTPRVVADATGTPVWRWEQQEPFGVSVPDENPSSLGAFEFPLRFPGQYADKETNLNYNYLRDYDSIAGRYVQSDPIGLHGGLNTYGYVGADPLSYIDPTGEKGWATVGGVVLGAGTGAVVASASGQDPVVGAIVGAVLGGLVTSSPTAIVHGGFTLTSAGFGAISGYSSAYVSSGGSTESGWLGALVGSITGGVFKTNVLGSIFNGMTSSTVGQAAGNAMNPCKDISDIDPTLSVLSGTVGGLSRGATIYLNSTTRSANAYILSQGLGPGNATANQAMGSWMRGTIVGISQYAYKPPTSDQCKCRP